MEEAPQVSVEDYQAQCCGSLMRQSYVLSSLHLRNSRSCSWHMWCMDLYRTPLLWVVVEYDSHKDRILNSLLTLPSIYLKYLSHHLVQFRCSVVEMEWVICSNSCYSTAISFRLLLLLLCINMNSDQCIVHQLWLRICYLYCNGEGRDGRYPV